MYSALRMSQFRFFRVTGIPVTMYYWHSPSRASAPVTRRSNSSAERKINIHTNRIRSQIVTFGTIYYVFAVNCLHAFFRPWGDKKPTGPVACCSWELMERKEAPGFLAWTTDRRGAQRWGASSGIRWWVQLQARRFWGAWGRPRGDSRLAHLDAERRCQPGVVSTRRVIAWQACEEQRVQKPSTSGVRWGAGHTGEGDHGGTAGRGKSGRVRSQDQGRGR